MASQMPISAPPRTGFSRQLDPQVPGIHALHAALPGFLPAGEDIRGYLNIARGIEKPPAA